MTIKISTYNFKKKKEALENRLNYQRMGEKLATVTDTEFAFFCALYWGEGNKSPNTFGITNMDVDLLKFVVNVLKHKFHVEDTDIALKLQYFQSDISHDECVEFWKTELNLFNCRIQKPTIKEKKSCKNKNVYGICTIKVYNTELVQKIYGGIKQYGKLSSYKWAEK